MDEIHLPDACTSLLLVRAKPAQSQGIGHIMHRPEAGADWIPAGSDFPLTVGRLGLALDNYHFLEDMPGWLYLPEKSEGDERTPIGIYAMRGLYGYADELPENDVPELSYVPSDPHLIAVDDSRSRWYNQVIDTRQIPPEQHDWTSHEQMRRADDQYKYVIDLDYNGDHFPGKGSCILIHIWRAESEGTAGCIAMSEPDMLRLLACLTPSFRIVILPTL